MWRRGFGEGARRPRAERGGGGTKRRTQGGKCLGLESSWPHCTRSSTNLEYRLTGRPPDHEDCQHPGIRTTWPSKGRSPSYPERLVLVVVVVVLVALFLPGRQTDRDGPSNGPPPPLHLHSAPVREKGVSSSSSSSSYRSHFLISKRSVFVDERIPSKSNPVARGERDTISWRMAVSTFPRIAAREEELDRRTHRCRSDLRRDFRISQFSRIPTSLPGKNGNGREGRRRKRRKDRWSRRVDTHTHASRYSNVLNATRRDAHRPLLGGYGRARDRGITAGPVASLPSPPSPPARATVFRWWDTSRLLARHTRSPTIASLSPSSSYTCALRVRRRTRARTSGCAPDRGQRERERGEGQGERRRAVGTEENVSRIPPLRRTSPAPSTSGGEHIDARFTYAAEHARKRSKRDRG